MPTIFIVQDDGTKNFSALKTNGVELTVITTRDCPMIGHIEEHVTQIETVMSHFNPICDSLVPVGCPINIGLAFGFMMRKGGGIVLKWDRQYRVYFPVRFDMFAELHTRVDNNI